MLTGAGVSAESGVPTFRGGADALWENHRPEELATPGAYRRDPGLVWSWYAWRYGVVTAARPNRAHALLAGLERDKGEGFLLATQNVDGLHGRACSRRLVELHGNLGRARCEECGERAPLPPPEVFSPPPACPRCGAPMRPDVVWFGEGLPVGALEAAWRAFGGCEAALVVGTSAVVEPAASLGRVAKRAGAYLVEVNPEATPLSSAADLALRAGAAEGLALLLEPL